MKLSGKTPGEGGVLTYKMGMYVPPEVKKRGGAYGADQIEKVGAFRAKRTVKVLLLELIELGKMEKVGALRANRTENVANKSKKRGALPRHIPVLL